MKKKNFIVLLLVFIIVFISYVYSQNIRSIILPTSITSPSNIKDRNVAIRELTTSPTNMQERFNEDFRNAAEALQKNENDYEALLTVARIRDWSGDQEGAIEIYEKMTKIKPNDLIPYFNMGGIYLGMKNYDKAGEMYEKVIEINPKWINAYSEIFSLYRFKLTHKYDDKIENILKSGLEASKDLGGDGFSDYYAMLGIYYKEKNDKEKAIENFEMVLKLDPENNGAKSELDELKNSK